MPHSLFWQVFFSVFPLQSGGECHAEGLHPIRGRLWDQTRRLLNLSPVGQVHNASLKHTHTHTQTLVSVPCQTSYSIIFFLSFFQVSSGWPEHACSAGWWRHQGWRLAVISSFSKRRTGRATAVSLWDPREVLVQADVSVWALLHQSRGDHTCCSCCYSGNQNKYTFPSCIELNNYSVHSALRFILSFHFLSRPWRWVTSPLLWPVSCVWPGQLQRADLIWLVAHSQSERLTAPFCRRESALESAAQVKQKIHFRFIQVLSCNCPQVLYI